MTALWVLLSFVIGVWVGFGWSAVELRKEKFMRQDVFNKTNDLLLKLEKAFGVKK